MSEQKFPKRVWIDPKQFGSFNLIHAYEKTDMVDDIEYLSLEEHQHILAEKDKRIEELREALKFYSGGEMSDIDMDIFDKIRLNTKDPKHVYVEWVDTEWLCNPARAALQEDGK